MRRVVAARVARRAGTFLLFASTAAAACAGAGCGLIVGTDDYTTSSSVGGASGSTGSSRASSSTGTGIGHSDAGSTGDGATGETGDGSSPSGADGSVNGHDGGATPDGGPGGPEGGTPEAGVGGDGGPTHGGDGGNVCSPVNTNGGCEECWQSYCCSQYTACLADPGCAAMMSCIDTCFDEPCGCTAPAASLHLYTALVKCGVDETLVEPSATDSSCGSCEAASTGDFCYTGSNCAGVSTECLVDGYEADSTGNCAGNVCSSFCTINGCKTTADCAGSYGGGVNSQGTTNACVIYDTSYGYSMCFPTCDALDPNACAAYPTTRCTADIDVDGNPANVCE